MKEVSDILGYGHSPLPGIGCDETGLNAFLKMSFSRDGYTNITSWATSRAALEKEWHWM